MNRKIIIKNDNLSIHYRKGGCLEYQANIE